MESREKELITALEVQQSIEHFKEQYLHSLGRNLSKPVASPASAFLSSPSSSTYVRRKSLSGVGARPESFSSCSSPEENLLASSGAQLHDLPEPGRRNRCLGNVPSRPGHPRVNDCESGLQPPASSGTSTDTSEGVSDCTKFKETYISSLGLLHKYRRQNSLPCLKDRVAEFETLMAKSTISTHSDVLFSNSKISEHQNICHNSQNSFVPMEINKYSSQITSTHTSCLTSPNAVPSNRAVNICYTENNDHKHNMLLDDFHSPEGSVAGDNSSSTDTQTHSSNWIDHYQLTPDSKSTASFALHDTSTSLSSSSRGNVYCYGTEIPNQETTAQPFGSRRSAFENQPREASPAWDKHANKHSHFSFEQPAIHKAYTEKEKAFILESMRKSGGRQTRTRSLGSCFSLQTEPPADIFASKAPKQSPLPCKLTQSVTNIISIFEAAHHSEPEVPLLRPDLHGKVRPSESCSKQIHNNTEPCLSEKERLQTAQFGCDNFTEHADLDPTHCMDRCFIGPDASFREKDSSKEETFRKSLDFSTNHYNNSVRQNNSDNVSRVDRMFQMPHTTEDDKSETFGHAHIDRQKDVVLLYHQEVDSGGHTKHCLCPSNRFGQSLGESQTYNYTHVHHCPPGDAAGQELSDTEGSIISRDRRDDGYCNTRRDCSLMKYPHSHPDCTLANAQTVDMFDANLGIPPCVFNRVNVTDDTNDEPSNLLINTLLVHSQSDRKIKSNILENIATVNSAISAVFRHEKPSVPTGVVREKTRCGDENISEKNREPCQSLGDKSYVANLDVDSKEGNLTTAINIVPTNDEKKTIGETQSYQYCILPHCDVEERENSVDVTGAISYLDKSNGICNTNNLEAHSEQTPIVKDDLVDAPDDDNTSRCVQDIFPVKFSSVQDSFLGVNTFDSTSSGYHVLSHEAAARCPGDNVAEDYPSTESRKINNRVYGLVKLSESDDNFGKGAEDTFYKCRHEDDVIRSRRCDTSEHCDWLDKSLNLAVRYPVSENSIVNLEGHECDEKTSFMTCEGVMQGSDIRCSLHHEKLEYVMDSNRTNDIEASTVGVLPDVDSHFIGKSQSTECENYSPAGYTVPSEQPNMPVCFRSDSDFFLPSGRREEQIFTTASTSKVENFIASLIDCAVLECSLQLSKSLTQNTFVISPDDRREATDRLRSRELHETAQVKVPIQSSQAEYAQLDYALNTVLDTDDDRDIVARDEPSKNVYAELVSRDNIQDYTSSCDNVSLQADWTSGMDVVKCLPSAAGLQNSLSGSRDLYCNRTRIDNTGHKAHGVITDKAENPSVTKSGAFYSKASCSDISDSVESFYSGSSEEAESFHSAEDMEVLVDNGDHTCCAPKEAWTPVWTDYDEDSNKKEHICSIHDLYAEQAQCYSNGEGMLDVNIVKFTRSDCPTDLGRGNNIWSNELSEPSVLTDDNIESPNCTHDWTCTFDTSVDLQAPYTTERGLHLDPVLDESSDSGEYEYPDHVESDQSRRLHIIDTSDNTLYVCSNDNTQLSQEVVSACLKPAEGSDINNRINTTELSHIISNEKLYCISETDVRKEIRDSSREMDNPVNSVFQPTGTDQEPETVVDECGQELFGDTCIPDPANKVSSEEHVDRNQYLPQCCHVNFNAAHLETAMSVKPFSDRVDMIETYPGHCNLTPVFIAKENRGCQSDSLSNFSVDVQQCLELTENGIDDICIDETQSPQSRDKLSTRASPDHPDIDDICIDETLSPQSRDKLSTRASPDHPDIDDICIDETQSPQSRDKLSTRASPDHPDIDDICIDEILSPQSRCTLSTRASPDHPDIDDICIDETLSPQSRGTLSTRASPDHPEIDGSGADEYTSFTVFRDSGGDNNTDSEDNESMDIDSLEGDTDGGRKSRVVVNTANSTTTADNTNNSSSSSSGELLSPSCPCYLQSEAHSLCPATVVSTDKAKLSGLPASESEEYSSSHAGDFNYPMTLDQSQAEKQIQNTLSSQGHKSAFKEKRWKEAEDASISRGNTSIRSPQKVNSPVHLDLASTEMTDLIHVDINDILESPGAGLHRIPSAGAFQATQPDVNRLDPYRFLERSQSDASLLKRDMEMLATDDDVHLTAAESSSGQNISECNRVYLDLSRAEAFERVELGDSSGAMMRTSSGRLLETIPQDEELKTGDLSYVYASHRSFSQESSSSMEDLTFSPKTKNKDSVKYKSCGKSGQENSITCSKSSLRSSFQIYSHSLKQKVRQLQMGSVPEQLNALTELNVLMEQAWSMPIYGKDLAYELCDILRTESALDIIVSNLASTNRELMKVSARLLEQSLTTSNRRQVAENGLELVVKMAHDARGDCELAQICTGILESLFKTSEDTCSRVIKLGGLDTITYWCRCNDRVTLKNCAIALSNLALYGGGENQQEMAKHKVPEWLFPLAFVDDDSVRYYALLAIGVLVSNKEIENAVTSSGTLALVLPFIDSHDPAEFAERDTSHRHGRSPGWLKRLIPVLSSKREEAQALAAFHFVMEAGIKSEQGRKEVLYKIGAVDPLKWLASTPNRVASKLAAQALKIIGEEIPHKLSQQVPLWACDDVVHWIGQVGFATYTDKFRSCHVDGDLLLRLTDEELRDSLGMSCSITRKRFLRELRDLKISSDYTSCDPSMLGAWLQEVGEDMSQYTYQMLHQGVDRPLLRSLTDSLLIHDCKIVNGIHRMKILSKIEELRSVVSSPSCPRCDSVDGMSMSQNPHKTPIDVFISYRRSNGSQLASLLKVHLQLRGFTVFIDIEKLRAGKFDESLLESVRQAKNFIIVLTQNSLDRCMGDDDKKDWVHREITAAIEAGSNIIPLLDNFKWPSPESLPEDMRSICYFNYVRWIHDYQDACVDKLEKFLRGETNPQLRHPVGSAASNSSSNNIGTSSSLPKQTSGFESPNSPPYQRAQGMRKMNSVESPVDSS